jgi:hypothetical protein
MRFYVREDHGQDAQLPSREQAEQYATRWRRATGSKDVRVGEVVPRREREARDALVAAALEFERMPTFESERVVQDLARAYRKAVRP